MNALTKSMAATLFLAALIGFFAGCASPTTAYRPFQPTMAAGAAYRLNAANLHPTQFSLGWREVLAKRKLLEETSPPELLAYLHDKDVPIVIGPGGIPYMTDGHHTLRGLLVSRIADKTAYGHVLANWSHLDAKTFWQRMVENNYTHLKTAQSQLPQDPAALPADLTAMQLDPYRGLAWGVMVAGGFAERKDVYFQEFAWANYFRDRVRWDDGSDTNFARAVEEASELAHHPAAAALPGYSPTKVVAVKK